MSRWASIASLAALFGASAWLGYAWSEPAAPAPGPPPAPPPLPPVTVGDLDGGGGGKPPLPKDDAPVRLVFDDLSAWDLDPKDVRVPQSILDLGGRNVDLVGYMVPYGDPDSVEEFLLVRDLGSCCFGMSPLPHHVVECRMVAGKKAAYLPGPVRVRGRFRVEEHRVGGYLISVYAMTVDDCVGVR